MNTVKRVSFTQEFKVDTEKAEISLSSVIQFASAAIAEFNDSYSSAYLYLKTDGTIILKCFNNELSLKEVRDMVEGYVSYQRISDDFIFAVNDDAKMLSLKENPFITTIAGNIVIIYTKEDPWK